MTHDQERQWLLAIADVLEARVTEHARWVARMRLLERRQRVATLVLDGTLDARLGELLS